MVEGTSVPFFIMSKEYILLERMCAWFVYQAFELNEDNLEKLSSLFVEWQMLGKIETILDTDADFYYDRLDVSVFAHDVCNKNKMKKPGEAAKSIKHLVNQLLNTKLKHENDTNEIKL